MDKDFVFPPRNLPGVANEWGRTQEEGFRSNAQSLEILGQSLQGLNRSTAASLQDLSRQVKDLVGRVSYTGADDSQLVSWTATAATNLAYSPTISFTLTEARRVNVVYYVRVDVSVAANSNVATSSATTGIQVDGSYTTNVDAGMDGLVWTQASPTSANLNSSVIAATASCSLPAGSHTVRGYIKTRVVSAPGTSTGGGTLWASYIQADVLQPL